MKLPAYPRAKPSGVEWLGDVPVHWDVSCLKYSVKELYSGGTPESGNPEYWAYDEEDSTPWVAIGDMTRAAVVSVTDKRITSAGQASKRLRVLPVGTLLYSMYASLGKVAVLGIPATVNQAILGIVPDSMKSEQGFLRYWLIQMENHLELFSSSNTQDNLNAGKVRALPLVVPPPAEQRSIAAFLDRETGRVDRLVAKKRELIERLKEKRTALISRTVTRGLPPAAAKAAGLRANPSMKDSGIEWLGEIPAHWIAKKLGYGAWLQGGYAFASDKFDSEGVPVVRMNNLKRGILDTSQASCVAPENCIDAFALDEGDLVWGMSGSIGETGSLGNFARVQRSNLPAQLNQRVGRFRVIGVEVSLDFLTYVIQTKLFYDQILLFVTGTAQFNVSSAQVQSVLMPFPPLQEQEAIAAYLNRETSKLDALVGKVEEAVERLQEYRTALITAAVTGKIDVRKVKV